MGAFLWSRLNEVNSLGLFMRFLNKINLMKIILNKNESQFQAQL